MLRHRHRHRRWHTLSDGERQRVQIARALAQQPHELLLPTNHVGISLQLNILALVSKLPVTSYIALHDLNLAAVFCNRVVVLDHGSIVATGTTTEVTRRACDDPLRSTTIVVSGPRCRQRPAGAS